MEVTETVTKPGCITPQRTMQSSINSTSCTFHKVASIMDPSDLDADDGIYFADLDIVD